MDSNDVHRHKHRHMHTHHIDRFRCMARICMFRCMFRIVCLDECLGFTLRKINFPKNVNNITQIFFLINLGIKIPLNFPFLFLNKNLINFNHTQTTFCKRLIPPHIFYNLMPLRPLSLFFKLQFSNLKSTNKNKNIFGRELRWI